MRRLNQNRAKMENNQEWFQASTTVFTCTHAHMHTYKRGRDKKKMKSIHEHNSFKLCWKGYLIISPSYWIQELGSWNILRCFLGVFKINIELPTVFKGLTRILRSTCTGWGKWVNFGRLSVSVEENLSKVCLVWCRERTGFWRTAGEACSNQALFDGGVFTEGKKTYPDKIVNMIF